MSTRLVLIRHGATDWNDQHRFIGRSDLPLNANGIKQAQALGNKLDREQFDLIISSNLKRAAETAELIVGESGNQILFDDRLREVDFGSWEGLTLNQINEQYPGAFQRWRNDLSYRIPEAEDIQDTRERVKAFLDDLLKDHSGKTILVISHGSILQMVIYLILEIPFVNDWKFYMYNGSVSEILISSDRTALVRLNDTSHLTD